MPMGTGEVENKKILRLRGGEAIDWELISKAHGGEQGKLETVRNGYYSDRISLGPCTLGCGHWLKGYSSSLRKFEIPPTIGSRHVSEIC